MAGQYDNPIPTRFLAPIDCLKIPAQGSQLGPETEFVNFIGAQESISGGPVRQPSSYSVPTASMDCPKIPALAASK
jgi:hypothetical protein